MNAEVQTKQAVEEMAPETVRATTDRTTERWVCCTHSSFEGPGCRSYFRLSWRSCITDL